MTTPRKSKKVLLKYKVRRAKLSDIDVVLSMARELHNQHNWSGKFNMKWKREYFRRILRHPNNICFVAENNGKLIGYMLAHLEIESAINSFRSRPTELYVLQKFRRLGIAHKLLSRIIDWSIKHDSFEIEVNIALDNPFDSLKIFREFNFSERSITLVKTLRPI